MKKTNYIHIAILMHLILYPLTGFAAFTSPVLGLKLIAQSRINECPECVRKLEKNAVKILNKELKKGKTIESTDEVYFMKNEKCKDGELLIYPYHEQELLKLGYEHKESKFPLLTFYFHTKSHHMIGIDKGDETSEKFDAVYGSHSNKGTIKFKGKIQIIHYPYGDGETFIYYKKENKIQVHCKIIELDELK